MGFVRKLPATLFGLDTRSLAAFRIGFGLIVVLDVLNRFPDLTVHYTDAGALPRWAVTEHIARAEHISLHMASGTWGWELFLFVVEIAFGLMLLVGFRTRLATIACWALTVSLHNRNPLVLHSGDVIIRLMLFWAIFLPLGARWSIDARRPLLRPEPPATFASVGSAAFVVQLAYVYVFTWLLKTGAAWHNGTAVYYTLQIDHFAKQPQSHWMLQHLDALRILTHATIVFEIAGPLLLLVPFFTGPLRTALVFAFWGLHLGFFAFMELGLFPWTCIAAWAAVLPGWFWDRFRVRATHGSALRAPVWMDVVAGSCLALVTWWNLSTIEPSRFSVAKPVAVIGRTLRLDQKWEMFAPYPLKDDGWFVIAGRLHDETETELLRGGPVSFEKPEGIAASYHGQRWSKYMRNLYLPKYKAMRLYYGRYLCRTHNAGKNRSDRDALEGFEMFYMKEVTPPPGSPDPVATKVSLWKHHCYSDNAEAPAVESTDEGDAR
jgi:hypothetical protein